MSNIKKHKLQIDMIKHSYMYCILCKTKNCSKGCVYFCIENKELSFLLLDEYLKLLDKKQVNYTDIKKTYKNIENHLKDTDKIHFNEIKHTKMHHKIENLFIGNNYYISPKHKPKGFVKL